MRTTHRHKPLIVIALLAFVAAAEALQAQDIMKLAPEGRTVLVENERVRMIETVLKPGDKEPMHSHPAYIFYALTPMKVRVTLPDGKTTEAEFKAGEAAWRDGATHIGENIGTTEGRFLIIELKEPPKKK